MNSMFIITRCLARKLFKRVLLAVSLGLIGPMALLGIGSGLNALMLGLEWAG